MIDCSNTMGNSWFNFLMSFIISDMSTIQDALLEITGARSVPRVFINGVFYGGGDETSAGCANGDFAKKVAQK